MSGTLVSPGVSVTVTDESQYGASGPGTVPLIVIATASNKIQPGSTTAIAPGTNPANSGTLWLITSQRDALQTFGTPTFYSTSGSPQYDNELNEVGLFSLYEYLGIANQAYVLRADLDLSSLVPTTKEPTGPATTNQNWLNLSSTTWGIFRSNGNPNPSFTWQPKAPLVINSDSNLEKIVQGQATTLITSASASAISSAGNLVINNVIVPLLAGDSISNVISKINSNTSLQLQGISATAFVRKAKLSPTGSNAGDTFNLRCITSNLSQDISFMGTATSILADLGLTEQPTNVILPANSYGASGNYAVNTLADESGMYTNQIWEKITLTTSTGAADWWFHVGSTDATYPGWGWREAAPRVLSGSMPNPVLTAGTIGTIKIGDTGTTVTVTVPSPATLAGFVAQINLALANTPALATVTTSGNQNFLTITNYAGTSITINNVSDQNGVGTPWTDAGLSVSNTYWGSVAGTVANPTFTAPVYLTSSATVSVPGAGYNVNDVLTVVGGTLSVGGIPTQLTVTSLQGSLPSNYISAAGNGYAPGDTLTFFNSNYSVALVLSVDSINNPTDGAITGLSVVQAGQYNGSSAPTVSVSPTSTSGTGVGAQINLQWGVNTVSVSQPGSYATYPTNIFTPGSVDVTGGSPSSQATFVIIPGYQSSDVLSIDPGTGPQLIHVPTTSLDDLITEINTVFSNGPIVASKTTVGSSNYLTITNTNNTSFVVADVHGRPLNSAGIAAGVTFSRALVYQGYSPSLTVPNMASQMASQNVWINTTPSNQGASYVVQTYINGSWVNQNIAPNTGTIPMYSSDSYANAGFGSNRSIGSIYVRYNSDGDTPPIANHVLYQWSVNGSWVPLVYSPSASAPSGSPADGTLWYNPSLLVDVMVNNGQQWLGYRQLYPATDPNGVIVSSAQPVLQSTQAPLVDYDLWLDSSNPAYPALYRYNLASASWIAIDNTDHVNSSGIIFADARPNADGTQNGSTVASDLLMSAYVDPDAPNAELYPAGILLFNTRYSTNNVKVFRKNYFPGTAWPSRWVTASGNRPDGSPYMGSAAQRVMVVEGLKAELANSEEARAEQNYFNIIATPGYTECISDMISLNVDKKQVAFVIGDTPSGLQPTGTAISQWAKNSNNADEDGPDGLVSASPYAAVYYPWGLGTNLDGTSVLVPPSMIALRTIAYNDQVAYPWFAPAGFNRGLVSGVTSVGYLDSYGNYNALTLNQGQRDVLYSNKINPIAYIPGRGLVVFGQKTLNPTSTALDRINVVRLVCDLAYNLDNLAQPFLFEQNDSITQRLVTNTFTSFMNGYKSLRAVYDYSVVCDSSNNTPSRVDQNQLWIDIAIQPEKSIEFIYIPVRILNSSQPLPGGSLA